MKYGGDTTCIEIAARSGETIIIDAGTGLRCLGNSLIDRNITRYTLLMTHVHWDHIMGFAFFRPLQFSRVKIAVQDRIFSGIRTREAFNEVMKAPFFPIGLKDMKADIRFDNAMKDSFSIGSIRVDTIPTSHNNGGLGYRFTENNKTFVFLTDNELGFDHPESRGFDAYADFSRDADLLFHDGEFTPDDYPSRIGWGHSSVEDVVRLAIDAGVRRLGIFHLNQDRTDEAVDTIVSTCQSRLARAQSSLDCFAVPFGLRIRL